MPGNPLIYQDEDLLAAVRRAKEQLGRIPTRNEFRELYKGQYNQTIYKRFGSWQGVIEMLYGTEAVRDMYRHRNRLTYTRDELIAIVRQTVAELGYIPSRDEFLKIHNGYYINPITRHYGGWRALLSQIYTAKELRDLSRYGYKPRKRGYQREDLLQALRDFYDRHGRVPLTKDFGHDGLASSGAYKYQFPTLNHARLEAGLKAIVATNTGVRYELTAEELKLWHRGDYRSGVIPKAIVDSRERRRANLQRKQQEN